jgi:hypothetical protein
MQSPAEQPKIRIPRSLLAGLAAGAALAAAAVVGLTALGSNVGVDAWPAGSSDPGGEPVVVERGRTDAPFRAKRQQRRVARERREGEAAGGTGVGRGASRPAGGGASPATGQPASSGVLGGDLGGGSADSGGAGGGGSNGGGGSGGGSPGGGNTPGDGNTPGGGTPEPVPAATTPGGSTPKGLGGGPPPGLAESGGMPPGQAKK